MALAFRSSKDGDADTFAVVTRNDSSNYDGMAQFQLPTYSIEPRWKRSSLSPLTVISIVTEIRANYNRCRSILFETARRKRPFVSLMSKNRDRIILSGPASELDRALNGIVHECSLSGDFGRSCLTFCRQFQVRESLRLKWQEESSAFFESQEELILNDPEIQKSLGMLLVP